MNPKKQSIAGLATLLLLGGAACGDTLVRVDGGPTVDAGTEATQGQDAHGEPLCVFDYCGHEGMDTEAEFESLVLEFYDACLRRTEVECPLPCAMADLAGTCDDPGEQCKEMVNRMRCTTRTIRHTRAMLEIWECEEQTAYCEPVSVFWDYDSCAFDDEVAVQEVLAYRRPDPTDAISRPICN